MSYLAVFVGGGAGSVARFLLARWALHFGARGIWGTLAANVAACALLGYLATDVGRASDPLSARLLLATGFCGGFSTFSTFGLEVVTLLHEGRTALALGYAGLSLLLGVGTLALFWTGR